MTLDQICDAPDILMEFLEYHSTVRGHSDKTVMAYYTDLKILFRLYFPTPERFVVRRRPSQSGTHDAIRQNYLLQEHTILLSKVPKVFLYTKTCLRLQKVFQEW